MSTKCTDEHTPKDNFVASLGYFFVALLSALSALILNIESYQKINFSIDNYTLSILIIIGYVCILFPYLLAREALLEREIIPDINHFNIKTIASQFPIVIFVSIFIIEYLLLNNLKSLNEITGIYFTKIIVSFTIATFPFLFLHFRSTYLLKNNKVDIAYSFLESILIPSLYVCILPFSFAWMIANNSVDIYIILITSSYLLILSLLISFFNGVSDYKSFIIILGYTFIFYVGLFFINNKFNFIDVNDLKGMIIGILLALTLGVAEVTKRAFYTKEKDRYIPKVGNPEGVEDYDFYFGSAKYVGITIPLFLPLVTLFWTEISVELFYFIPALQIIHWFYIIKKDNITVIDKNIALGLGFLLPLSIIILLYFNIEITIVPIVSTENQGYLEMFLAFVFFVMLYFMKYLRSKIYDYYRIFNAAIIILIVISFMKLFFGMSKEKLNIIIFLTIYMWTIVSIIVNFTKIKKLFIVSNKKKEKMSNDE